MKNGLYLPGDTDLYCLTAEKFSKGRSNTEIVGKLIESDIKIIQYREKEKSMREKYGECLKIREMTKNAGVTFIVNDDVALALAVDADGVHIGQDDLPIHEVRKIVGNKIIGLSTHSPEQAQNAVRGGADYIGVGPIYTTHTKADVCDAVGIEYLDYVQNNLDIPYTAIGGIKLHNMKEIVMHKAKCISMVTEIVGADDIPELIKNIRRNRRKYND
ncbi:MAG: thiamine phosphate synthase [Oscillospiraceae bacterium]|nr:thiamine phosphate synthase [Oscillospiraceae bacterium]